MLNSLEWRHNGRHGVSNHQRLDCSLKCLFRHRSKKTLASMKGIHQWPVVSLTKVLYRGKCFHLMTSSYVIGLLSNIVLWCSVMTHCWMIEIFGVRKYIYTLVKIIMELPLPKKPFCNWKLFLHRSGFLFEINVNYNDRYDDSEPFSISGISKWMNNLQLRKHQNLSSW